MGTATRTSWLKLLPLKCLRTLKTAASESIFYSTKHELTFSFQVHPTDLLLLDDRDGSEAGGNHYEVQHFAGIRGGIQGKVVRLQMKKKCTQIMMSAVESRKRNLSLL